MTVSVPIISGSHFYRRTLRWPRSSYTADLRWKKSVLRPREIFDQGRKLEPQSLDAEVGLGRATLGTGDSTAAEKLLKNVLARNPHQPQAIIGMLELSTLTKNWKEAARLQAERIALDPEMRCREYVRLARDYLRAGETAEGMRWLTKALERDPYCRPAHKTLAEQAISAHDWSNAKSHLEFFIHYAPDEDPTAYNSLAGVNFALGNYSAARAALEKGVRIFPGDANLRRLVAKTESAPRWKRGALASRELNGLRRSRARCCPPCEKSRPGIPV